MSRFIFALIAFAITPASIALADCNPPPPGLSFQQWTATCPDEIDYAYSIYGNGMDYDYFVQSLYGLYLNPPATGGPLVMSQCSPEGATQCNSSGWLYTCTGGQGLTGSTQC
ncbi:MAG: hypothetical protein ABIV25_08550 [Paracoccaceae bacterium]